MQLIPRLIKKILKRFLSFIGIEIISKEALKNIELSNQKQNLFDLSFFREVMRDKFSDAISMLPLSKSQLRQDLFVLHRTNFKKNGFFVEFGACDGIELSNTYLLETEFNWSGILAEPALGWSDDLEKNRKCKIVKKCVWRESDTDILFNEVGELSTISQFSNKDLHANRRKNSIEYLVKTISLNDLLTQNHAPAFIDYLSIDTEGSEFEILSALDFQKFSFGIITVEHNFSKNRDKVYQLLISRGYDRKFENISSFDDWYVKL